MKIWASLCLRFLIPISHRSKCISFTNSLNVPAQWQEELFWSRTLCAALCIGKIFCIQRTLWGTPNELKFEGFRHPYILPPCNYLKKYKYFFFQHFFDTRKKNPSWSREKKETFFSFKDQRPQSWVQISWSRVQIYWHVYHEKFCWSKGQLYAHLHHLIII